MKKTYYMGLVKDGKRLILQMRDSVDLLSPETWIYYGHRETTKKRIKELRHEILVVVNEVQHTDFKSIRIA